MSGVTEDAVWGDQNCGSGLAEHGSVVFVEVVVGAARCLEDRAKQNSQGVGVDAVVWVIGPRRCPRGLLPTPSSSRAESRL